jgi:hypothetical protein
MTGLSAETIAKLKTTNSATLSTLLLKRGLRNTAIRGVRPLRTDLEPGPNTVPARTISSARRSIPSRPAMCWCSTAAASPRLRALVRY